MIGKGVLKGVDLLARKSVDIAKKYPALTLGGVGVGIGAANSVTPGKRESDAIMREYLGAPGAKYSSCDQMEKFAERKMVLAAKLAFEKISTLPDERQPSFDQSVSGGAGKAVGMGVINEGIAALRRLVGMSSQAISSRYVDDPKREKIIEQVIKQDPTVRTGERENPGQAAQAYGTMRRFAPTLSTDPNVVTSFLRNSALTGGPMDFQTVKGLADAEHAVQRAQNEGAWLRGGL